MIRFNQFFMRWMRFLHMKSDIFFQKRNDNTKKNLSEQIPKKTKRLGGFKVDAVFNFKSLFWFTIELTTTG